MTRGPRPRGTMSCQTWNGTVLITGPYLEDTQPILVLCSRNTDTYFIFRLIDKEMTVVTRCCAINRCTTCNYELCCAVNRGTTWNYKLHLVRWKTWILTFPDTEWCYQINTLKHKRGYFSFCPLCVTFHVSRLGEVTWAGLSLNGVFCVELNELVLVTMSLSEAISVDLSLNGPTWVDRSWSRVF